MSRFKTLCKYLSYPEALSIYLKVKFNGGDQLSLKKLSEPFSLRNNPYDYATFEEVLLREAYNIPLNYIPSTIIDAGANIGLTAIFFANRFSQSIIVALEPDTGNFEMLTANTKAYRNIIPVKCGLWNNDAYLEVVDEHKGNNAFIVKESGAGKKGSIKAVSVTSVMDEFNWDKIDILKMDIEGSEKKVFEQGYEEWLPKVKILIIELHDRIAPGSSNAVFKALNNYNFSFDLKSENLIFTNTDLL